MTKLVKVDERKAEQELQINGSDFVRIMRKDAGKGMKKRTKMREGWK